MSTDYIYSFSAMFLANCLFPSTGFVNKNPTDLPESDIDFIAWAATQIPRYANYACNTDLIQVLIIWTA